MRRYLVGGLAVVCLLTAAAAAIAQISNGVPSANRRAGSPTTRLAGGWDQKILATGSQRLENPTGIFTSYGYLNDASTQGSGLKTKTEPDQNTYVVTATNPGGPSAGYDYGRHFLVQGHEIFIGGTPDPLHPGKLIGESDSAYITRINLDVPQYDKHRITFLSTTANGTDTGQASLDGSTYDPFAGKLLFTGEAGGNATYGHVWATPLDWSGTTAPAVSGLVKSMGYAGYEGVQVDDAGRLILEEDNSGNKVTGTNVKFANGYIYRFVPKDPGDLSHGVMQALQVSASGTALTFANQTPAGAINDPITGSGSKRLYGGEALSAKWIAINDSDAAGAPANPDMNALAKAAGATPFKRPENGRFVPGTGFRSFVFTVTGDTDQTAGDYVDGSGNQAADRAAWGALVRIDMPSSGAGTGTVRTLALGDAEHAAFDSITFHDPNTLWVGEDRGDALHAQLDALDSSWSFDLSRPLSSINGPAQRLTALGRDPESTDDVTIREAHATDTGSYDQNDGDNEVTGLLVSDGISTTSHVFGASDPSKSDGTRMFYTGQHGANVTYELLPPGPLSANTSPYCTCKGSEKTVSCDFKGHTTAYKARAASLIRGGRTYAKGSAASLRTVRTVGRGRYTLVVGSGRKATKLAVVVR